MSKKLSVLITSIIGACGTIAIAIVSYVEPANIAVINTVISGITVAVSELINLFAKEKYNGQR